MTQKSKKTGDGGKESPPEKSPPSGGESELATAMGLGEQPSEKRPGNNEGTDPDQQKGKKKGTVGCLSISASDMKRKSTDCSLTLVVCISTTGGSAVF